MRGLLGYLKNYKAESVIAPLFKFLEAAFEIIVPIIMAYIIDVGIKENDADYIFRAAFLMVGLGLFGFTCSMIAQYFSARAAHGYGTELRNAVYKKINALSFTEIDKIGSATLITRMTSDINQSEKGVNRFLRLFLRSPFIVIGAIVASFILNVELGLIVLGASLVIAAGIALIMYVTIPKNRQIQRSLDEVALKTEENLSGVRAVRAFSRQEEEKKEFKSATEKLSRLQLFASRISGLLSPLTYALVNLGIVLILYFGGGFVNDGSGLTQGEVSALINYMTQILLALTALSSLIITLAQASASSARIKELLDLPVTIVEGNDDFEEVSSPVAIRFKDVSFSYGDGKEVLLGIDLNINKGETVGIIGGTGSGKSTLINLIMRYYDVDSGEVEVDGVNVKRYKFSTLRGKIGIVPQEAVLFAGTIRENLVIGKEDATSEDIVRALRLSHSTGLVNKKKGGLNAEVERSGENFSGGQRQRLTIARALLGEREILIFDDAFSALDYATEKKLRSAIKSISATKIIVSQRAASIADADKIILMKEGRIAGIGSYKELFATSELFREIVNSQTSSEEDVL